ncbi:MAG: hypothetical protein J0647_09800 [Campylobacteraceae bacterium]|nr:hypothetical protein [Campylobacteraceae bacterium]
MKKYEINTCIRKIHFLAQTYHETQRFTTTVETSNGRQYDPDMNPNARRYGNTQIGDGAKYKGRGLIHLTWKNTYLEYQRYSGFDSVTNYQAISNDSHRTVDSSGWFWKNISHVTATNQNINLVADTDDVLRVSQCINGAVSARFLNGLRERIMYTNKLKEIFEYAHCH